MRCSSYNKRVKEQQQESDSIAKQICNRGFEKLLIHWKQGPTLHRIICSPPHLLTFKKTWYFVFISDTIFCFVLFVSLKPFPLVHSLYLPRISCLYFSSWKLILYPWLLKSVLLRLYSEVHSGAVLALFPLHKIFTYFFKEKTHKIPCDLPAPPPPPPQFFFLHSITFSSL